MRFRAIRAAAVTPPLVVCFLATLAVGCGDDGGDGEDLVGDDMAPTVQVAFPPPTSLTDAATITIRGRAEDPDGIAAVRVNGEPASTEDGFGQWQATVSLTHGSNSIVIASEDNLGYVEERAAEIEVVLSANWLEVPTAVAADTAGGRALVLDRVLDALLSIDYTTGERVIVSGVDIGGGPRLQDPAALVHDPDNDRVLVIDSQTAALLAIDLTTGERTPISDGTLGTGPLLNEPFAVTADLAMGRAWVLDVDDTDPMNPIAVIHTIDLTTGDREIVADPMTGVLPALQQPTALVVDPVTQQLYLSDVDVTDPLNPVPSIYQLDLATVALSVLSGAGPAALDEPSALALDPDVPAATLYVLDAGLDAVVSVSLATGERQIISEDGMSARTDFSVPVGLAVERVDAETTRALVIDTGEDTLVAADLATGVRSVVSGVAIGSGPELGQPSALVVDAPVGTTGRALVIDQDADAVFEVDLASGIRTLISGDDAGSGVQFDDPVALTMNVEVALQGQTQPARQVFVADASAGSVIQVDLASGARTVLSGPGAGSGTAFAAPRGLVLVPGDPEQGTADRLVVADENLGALIAVDLASGARTALTDADPGNGPVLGNPQALALELDEAGYTGRALVADRNPPALLAVDLAGGERVALSGLGVGDGAPFEDPTGVIIELERAPEPDPEAPDAGTGEPARYVPTGYALVVHSGPGALLAVELSNGRRTELSSIETGRGPVLRDPQAIALDPDNGRLVVADASIEGVLMVDLETRERVLISR